MREYHHLSAKEICTALLDYALKRDEELRQRGEQDRIDDKTVFIIKPLLAEQFALTNPKVSILSYHYRTHRVCPSVRNIQPCAESECV